jgi:DNA polymerase
MLIGEAPGKSEDELGRPFSGAAGRVLDAMLDQSGLSRSQVFITSVIKCRPPKNRNPQRQEIAACAEHLQNQIAFVKPSIIVLMGNVALQAILGPELAIGTVRGKVFEKNNQCFFPVYHPAAVLYNRSLQDLLMEDFCQLAHLLLKR